MLSAILSMVSLILGFLLKSGYDYFMHEKEREDKFFFAMLTKRFEVFQSAYRICDQVKSIIRDKTDERNNVLKSAQDWYRSNCLYLPPEIRKNLREVLFFDVPFYPDQEELFYITLNEKGKDAEETNKQRKDRDETWNKIMVTSQGLLEDGLSEYYRVIEKAKR